MQFLWKNSLKEGNNKFKYLNGVWGLCLRKNKVGDERWRGEEMCLECKLEDLSSIPGTWNLKIELTPESWPLTYTCALQHACTFPYNNVDREYEIKIKIWKIKKAIWPLWLHSQSCKTRQSSLPQSLWRWLWKSKEVINGGFNRNWGVLISDFFQLSILEWSKSYKRAQSGANDVAQGRVFA